MNKIIDDLKNEFYNAKVSRLVQVTPNLIRLVIRPAGSPLPFTAGQFTSLGLGNWEPSIAGYEEESSSEPLKPAILRRAYSICSPIFNSKGQLTKNENLSEFEFYISLISEEKVLDYMPPLTPKLFMLKKGSRLSFGPDITGTYTLGDVPREHNVILASTGTGLGPHNPMLLQLMNQEHKGPITIIDCNRYKADFAYAKELTSLTQVYKNLSYIQLTTREDKPKQYIQDFITANGLEEKCGLKIRADNSHFYLCGNPAMIGAPRKKKGEFVFMIKNGTVELLQERYALQINTKKSPGQIFYEQYW